MEKRGAIGKGHFIILFFAIFVLIVLLSVNLFFLIGRCGNLQGDANGDGAVNNLDVKHLRDFLDGQKLNCKENADFNSDGRVDILDGRALTTYLLSGKDERFSPDGELFGRGGVDASASGGSEGTGLGSRSEDRPRGAEGTDNEIDDECKTFVGDVNGDGKIDRVDYDDIIGLLTGRKEVKCAVNADVDYSGRVDSKDRNDLREYLFGVDDTGTDKKEDSCLDNDQGENTGIKGSVGGYKDQESFEKEDVCEGDELIEYYCEGKEAKGKKQVCSLGCEEGKCKGEEGKEPVSDICSDEEDEADINVEGIVVGMKNGVEYVEIDRCDGNALIEFSCKVDNLVEERKECANGCVDGKCIEEITCGNNPKGLDGQGQVTCDAGLACASGLACDCQEECADGLSCSEGVCISGQRFNPEDFCRDSDNGKISSVKGVVSGSEGGVPYTKTDFCKSGSSNTILIEYSCNIDSYVEEEIACDYGGCVDGVCVESSRSSCANNPAASCDMLSCTEGQSCQCNAECASGLTCISNVCSSAVSSVVSCTNNPVSSCDDALSCSIGQTCQCDAECTSGLLGGLTCRNNICSIGNSCTTSNPFSCDEALECDVGGKCSCHSECASGLQCGNDNVCVSASCTSNSQCASNLVCINGQCQTPPISCDYNPVLCNAQLDCSVGKKCDCYTECLAGDYCYGTRQFIYVCNAELAPVGAYTNSPYNCASKKLVSGQCVEVSLGGACDVDENCVSGAKCVSGICAEEPAPAPAGQTISCDSNPIGTCDSSSLDCAVGKRCDCREECSSGYCWGTSSSDMTCKSDCAPAGAYIGSSYRENCCSKQKDSGSGKYCDTSI